MTQKTIADYLALISPYFACQPNFNAVVQDGVAPSVSIQALLESLPAAFDLDQAIGVQLDAVGVRVGIARNLPFPLPEMWFSFGDPLRGWGVGIWKGPYGDPDGVTVLNDDIYRSLIRAKILANSCDGSLGGVQAVLDAFFAQFPNTLVFVDDVANVSDQTPGTMRAVIGIAGQLPPIAYMILVSRQILPTKTAGCSLKTLATTVSGAPLFGFGVQNEYISGWGTGAWGADPDIIGELAAPIGS